MKSVLVSLGANLGNSHTTINSAAVRLKDHFGQANVRLSSLLCCPAIGGPSGQDDFHNAVAAIEFYGNEFELWHALRLIEKDLGRERRHRWESRRIDLDILMFEQLRLWTPHLKIPHPRMVTRSFAILPASELRPNAIEPVSGLPLREIAHRLPYRYEPTDGQLSLILPSEGTYCPQQIRLICVGEDLAESLRKMVSEQISPWFKIQIDSINADINRDDFEYEINRSSNVDLALLVLAIVCPDPSIAAWEDYTRKWAQWLGFESDPQGSLELSYNAPRYLLNCFDLKWALHEIEAAISAMTCELRFATPGWTF